MRVPSVGCFAPNPVRKPAVKTVVVIEPGREPETREIPNTLEGMQRVVGGYIEPVGRVARANVWVDEEGLLKGKRPNRIIDGAPIVGPILIALESNCGCRRRSCRSFRERASFAASATTTSTARKTRSWCG